LGLVSESTAGLPYGGGFYKRTPEEQALYEQEYRGIPVRTTVPTPVIAGTTGISRGMAPFVAPGGPGEEAGYARIRELLTSGQFTPEQIVAGKEALGVSDQDIDIAFGRRIAPIKMPTPTLPGATTGTTQSIDEFIRSKAPTATPPTTPSMFSPENVRNQLELEQLRSGFTPKNRLTDLYGSFLGTQGDINRLLQEKQITPDQLKTMYGVGDPEINAIRASGITPYTEPTPVAGFAQGGLVGDDINRMLQNQRNAIQRESQSRQMLTNLGVPPVKKFSDGGPAGSSSGVRRLKMSGYQAGGDVTDEMFVGTAPSEESQQTTGEYIKGLYKENIPVHARVYLETLLGKKDPITAEDFTKEELADIEKLLSSKPAKGAVTEYSDYEKVRDLDREGRHSSDWLENLPSVGKTLGRFTYETLPDGRRVIKDTYDFYNTSRSINVQEFEEMGPAEKALAVFKKITANRSMMDPPFVKRAADILGEAYIGRDGRPVKVEYDPKDLPVKRQEGSPPEGEVNENPYVRMAREERAAQDKAFDSVNRQLSDLLERYKEGNEGITEKDLLPFFPGYNEYDIAQMYGTTTESSVPSMSSKARSFTPEIMSNLRKHDELMQKDFDRLVKEKRLPRDVITARTLGLAKGGEITNDEFIQEMITGTRPTDETTSPGILPPELREAIDVPLDFANLLIRGTAAVPIGGFAGLYKGITGGKYGTQEGVKEADTEAARMMAKITGEPKTQTAKDVLEFIGGKAQEYKLDAALPQLLTLPSPGPGAASALMRSYELAETPPSGVVKMPGGNWLKGQVEYFVRPLKKDIPWTQGQLEEMPGVAKAEAPNLALNKFIETGLTRYIKNDMASAKDTLRNLADENTIKAGKAYNNDLRQVKKAYDRAEKIKAEGPRPNMLPGTWENAIEAQLGRARQLEEEANRKLNLELRHALPFPVLQEDGELAGGLNFHMRRNLQTGGKETLVSSRKEAGQAEEGVAQTPTGKVWETMADLFVKPQAAGQITDQDYFMRSTDSQRVLRNNPWLATVPPETPVYIPQDVFRSSSFLNSFSPDDLGFKHITDELANAMNPGSGLPANLLLTPDEVANMGMEKAARHVIEVNKWREEQMGVVNALRAQKSISLYKDYPTIPGKTEPNQRGLQWLELKLMPEDDTPESMVKAKEALADALKYEGEVMGHCVGGECPKVESGKSRIISLRDAKGEPHVTLEVIPPEVNFSDVLGGNPAFPNRDPELYRMMDTMTTTQIEKTPLYKEKAAAIAAQKLPGISQIKGKGNNRPPDSYQPFITDFIASQQWSSVGDLQNTNLVRIEPMILKNAQDRGFNPQIVTTIKERPYITKEEFNRLADLFGGMNKYAAGGEVTDFIKRAA
jgi:hypothetical protein